ncbi:GNAT family N-acetyltransferase [Couchioplanes caeruleus]|uniref:GNAT family N-acetyltransferase n=2 Tax=Couchioplanes caeruleus TaxID=56438 RepID=A0A1K0GBR0_9ACTN|nr:GNAT family N-acetyltransferase [Couchioplanes caeruleus]OJF14674.1 GNAT family N-acetyltransferase [Couchioplanes caeruleus subsp. caeruleus]ROP30072.1 acetyltransferase (GNAT) family protein [Couchioplanes caeruleus]
MSVLLRPAVDTDLAGIGELHHRSRASAYADLLSPAALAFGGPEAMGEWWTERWKWERDTHRLTVATVADELAGFSYLGPSDEEGVAELTAIHAAPEFVGTGVGRALMRDALPALARIADRAALWVLEGNDRARLFYERGGWTPDGNSRIESMGGDTVRLVRYSRPV